MTSSRFHVPFPRVIASQIVTAGPPAASILFSLPSAKNARKRLSGDQNGYIASFVPARACAEAPSSG
jgi:hypothetical protein